MRPDSNPVLDRALGAYLGLALGDALLRAARTGRPFDTGILADGFVAWWRARPVDCGNTCRRGIQRYINDGSLEAPPNDGDAGNGALMRNLPVVLATLGSMESFKRVSIAQAHITHNHRLSDAAVLGIGHLLRSLLRGADRFTAETMCDVFTGCDPLFRYRPYPGRASAYVVDTVQTVLHYFLEHQSFEEALIATVNQGDDADTTGALVGMLAGARCGASALPQRWLRQLSPAVVHAVTDQASALLALSLEPAATA